MKDLLLSLMMTSMLLPVSTLAQETFREVDYTPARTVFKLNSPTSVDGVTGASQQASVPERRVRLNIYDTGEGGKKSMTVKMKATADNVWTASVDGNLKGKFYTFDIGEGETPGVFAKAVGINGQRGAIIDLADTNPEGWENDVRPPLASPADLVIYEMHFRDFSVSRNLHFPSDPTMHPGKFLALTEPWAASHLRELGINAIHLLPSFDYGSVDETRLAEPQYNWGYDPVNYNVPDGGYSTDPYTPETRIREFKQMVQAMHKAGIRVILDVVYNHTFDLKSSNFQKTWPDYYYRFCSDGTPSDGSGCGNETASEKPLMRQFMLESMKYWVEEYHVDGFRVDLMGVHDIETMNLIRAELTRIDPTLFIYGEGWSAGTCAYPQEKLAMKSNTAQMPGIAAFSDDMRDALRGPFSDDAKGAFLVGFEGEEESLKFGLVGGIDHPGVDMTKVNYDKEAWAAQPTQQISYVSCHDDMCLVDRLRTSITGIKDDELIRLDLLGQTAVMLSQGVPFMLSGEEMLRDKKGVHNSYASPDSINQLPWQNLERYPQVFDYYKKLIRLRLNHPAFRLGDTQKVREKLTFLTTAPCLVAYRLLGGEDDPWQDIIVVLNANRESRDVTIPDGTYKIVLRDGVIDENGIGELSGTIANVPPQSALVLCR